MLSIKQNLTSKDKFELSILISELKDFYSEGFITKKGLRLFIKDNLPSVWTTLRAGDKLISGEEG